MNKYYLCIDLKSFYASVESVERGLDPFKTNLVVADPSRGKGAICLAITPALKELGIKNRCRLFQIPDDIEYITAMPRMKLYMEYSANIYSVYLRYVSKDDIHVYSIDECFFDITSYLELYNKTPKELAQMIIDAVYEETGICATAGIGTNMFLAKVALDVTAKHVSDHIGYLDKNEFERTLWHHRPLTDIWNFGRGIEKRLQKYGVYTLYDIAHFDEKILYKEFGVNAEFIIDHAKGIEPCTISEIKNFKAKTNSLSNSQILFEDYVFEDALLAVKEMVDLMVLDMVDKNLVTDCISLSIGYSKEARKSSGGIMKIGEYTDSRKKLMEYFTEYFKKTTDRKYPIRKITIGVNHLVHQDYMSFDLFTDIAETEKERNKQRAIIDIRKKFGKNAVLSGMNLYEKATTKKRNKLIGGHNGE